MSSTTRPRFRAESSHQVTDEGLLGADVYNAAHVAMLALRDVLHVSEATSQAHR